jgi:TNF receptor-associated protein 1
MEGVATSPFMEPFKGTDVPVLVLTNNMDELIFQQTGSYKNKKFTNVETSFDEIQKDLGKADEPVSDFSRIPEEDVTTFSLWLKSELEPTISKVQLSKRLKDSPAIVVGQMSSTMRMMQ